MNRRWVALLAGTAAAVMLAVSFTVLPRSPGTPSASHPSSPTPDPTAPADVHVGEIAWVYTPFPATGVWDGSFVLQAGTLAADAPLVDIEVPWQADLAADLARQPAVGPPIGNAVVYVADDGASSVIRRADIAEATPDVALAEIPEVVWDIAVAPDGSAAYVALTDRAQRELDLGVWRVRLDGSGVVEQVMEPVEVADRGGIVLAAFISFNVRIVISEDGRHLARQACKGSDGCALDVLDLASGDIHAVPYGEIDGMAGGFLVLTRCGEIGCRPQAIEIDSGVAVDLPIDGFVHVTSVDGRPVVITTSADGAKTTIDMIDIRSGERRVLFRGAPGSWSGVDTGGDLLTMAVPGGHIHVTQSTPLPEREGVAVVEMHLDELLISLEDGSITEIPPPPVQRPPSING